MDKKESIIQKYSLYLTGKKRISEYEKYRFICFALTAIHIILTLRFALLKYTMLAIYNVASFIFYFYLGMVYTEKEKFNLIFYSCFFEVSFFSCFATLTLGESWGFMNYLIALAPVSFYIMYSSPTFGTKLRKPFVFTALALIFYVVTRVLIVFIKPIYPPPTKFDTHLTYTYCFNAIVVFLVLFFFSLLFSIELRFQETNLKEQYKKLQNISSIDPLTGLINRRSMDQYLNEAVERSKKDGLVFSLVLGDIDDFKKVNDTYGHNVGDAVLVNVANTIRGTVPVEAQVCRWGGEEILIFIPENEIVTKGIAEKVRQTVEKIEVKTGLPEGPETISVTMTYGMAEYSPGLAMNKLVSIADERLYYGKHHGKNQVVDKL